ncbi:MAG: ATP-binding protein [Patescibacteria group bacterium]|nr:ATP-binding protein [Patescibacteria group bacterium]
MEIAIASGKGGVGKSMVASSLAILFSRIEEVVAVDADVDAPNLHLWLGEGEDWDLVEPLSTNSRPVIDSDKCTGCGKCVDICQFGALSFENTQTESPVLSERTGLVSRLNKYFCEGCGACAEVCPEGTIQMEPVENAEIRIKGKTNYGFPLVSAQLKPGETGSGKIVDEIKARAEEYDYEMLLIDVPAGTGCPVIAAIKDANFAVLVTEPTPSGLSDLKRVLEVINHFGVPFGVVVNKWDINSDLSSRIESDFEGKILGKISYDKGVFKAISNITPVLETGLDTVGELRGIFEKLSKCL